MRAAERVQLAPLRHLFREDGTVDRLPCSLLLFSLSLRHRQPWRPMLALAANGRSRVAACHIGTEKS